MTMEQVLKADEAWETGNAVGLMPVQSITYQGEEHVIGRGSEHFEVAPRLAAALTAIRMGEFDSEALTGIPARVMDVMRSRQLVDLEEYARRHGLGQFV